MGYDIIVGRNFTKEHKAKTVASILGLAPTDFFS